MEIGDWFCCFYALFWKQPGEKKNTGKWMFLGIMMDQHYFPEKKNTTLTCSVFGQRTVQVSAYR